MLNGENVLNSPFLFGKSFSLSKRHCAFYFKAFTHVDLGIQSLQGLYLLAGVFTAFRRTFQSS